MLKRLLGPTLVFLFFLASLLLREDVLRQFGDEALSSSYQTLDYAIQIGGWFSAAYLINRLIAVFLWEGLVHRTLHIPVPRLIRDVVAATLFVIALSGVAGTVFHYPLTGMWATSGVVGLILGFALRNIILDIFVGLAINFERPFRIGDWVRVHHTGGEHDVIGQVQEINWRTTRIKTIDSNIVVVPNSFMGTSVLTNFTLPDNLGRFNTTFYLDFSVSPERALRVLEAGVRAASTSPGFIEEPPPEVYIDHVDTLGVAYKVYYWVMPAEMSPRRARHLVVREVLEHLAHAGLTLAYPKEDIYHKPMPDRQLSGKTLEERVELLSRIEIFAPLEHHELAHLAEQMVPRRFAHDALIIEQGATGNSMFILLEGLLSVHIRFAREQEPVRVGKIGPGEFFGEMSLLTGEPRTATIRAVTDCVTYEITDDHMGELFRKRPVLVGEISRVMAERSMHNDEALAHLSAEKLNEHKKTLAEQFTAKIRTFFNRVFSESA